MNTGLTNNYLDRIQHFVARISAKKNAQGGGLSKIRYCLLSR
jgi:hypothetical protein